jgi:hypothetical protein
VGQVLESSRSTYGKSRSEVEDMIKKWNEIDVVAKPPSRAPVEQRPVEQRPAAAEKPYVRQENPRPRPAHNAQVVASTVQHQHTIAQSKAMRPETPKVERSFDKQDRPQLEGATSLRDALMQATGKTPPKAETAPVLVVHEPKRELPKPKSSLKDTLRRIVPPPQGQQSAGAGRPAGLPKDQLESMLAVDDVDA